MVKLKQKLRAISVEDASKQLQKVAVITGPSRLDYIEIENRRIWLFGDWHADHVKPKHASVRLDEWVAQENTPSFPGKVVRTIKRTREEFHRRFIVLEHM